MDMTSAAWRILCSFLLYCSISVTVYGQVESDERALIEVKNGITITRPDFFQLNLRFRMQNRFGFRTESGDDLSIRQFEARVRRLRLRFDGYVLDKKLRYYMQLSFSRADQDLETGVIAQTIRDAILYYHFTEYFYIGFGQSKLPGNRQRVTSSGNLQFAERSIANAAFNIDRDFGFFGYASAFAGVSEFHFKAAVTSGDGRNASAIDNGLAYTGRIEWLPLGSFANNGDYSEGDLEREPVPRISLAGGYSFNHKSSRVNGQLGPALPEPRDFHYIFADALFKYRGFAWSTEYMRRFCAEPVFRNAETGQIQQFVLSGQGINSQASYLFPGDMELALRYSWVQPDEVLLAVTQQREELLVGVTRYFNKHRIKAQLNAGYNYASGRIPTTAPGSYWLSYLQVEFGI